MGRKRTHHDATRTKIVSARLRPETYDLMSEHAEKLGLSRAGYIEHLIENRPVRLANPLTDALPVPLLNELKRIGNNLNQIAHARNAGLDVDARQFRTVVTEIVAALCSAEVLKRRYEAAEDEVAKGDPSLAGEMQRVRAAAGDAAPRTRPEPRPPDEGSGHRGAPPQRGHSPQFSGDAAALLHGARSRPRETPELRVTEEDIAHRHGPEPHRATPQPDPPRPDMPRAAAASRRTHDPKAPSSWFKLPWRL